MKLSRLILELVSNPEKVTTKGFLASEGPFSYFRNPQAIIWSLILGAIGLHILCLFPDFLSLQWLISRPATILQESVLAALLGKLIWESIQQLQKALTDSQEILGSKSYVYKSVILAGGLLIMGFPALAVIVVCVAFGATKFQLQEFLKRKTLQSNPLILGIVLAIALQCSIPLEALSFLVWDSFFSSNGFLITPSEILTAILVGHLLPLPLSIGGGAYLAFYTFGWAGLWGALFIYICFLGLNLFVNKKFIQQKNQHIGFLNSIEIPFVSSAIIAFLFLLGRYPSELGWSAPSMFVCLLAFALSIRQWKFLKIFSLGLVVAVTEITLEFISGGWGVS